MWTWNDLDSSALGVAIEGQAGKEYDESAFRYFLGVERARADRLHRPLRLLLVTQEPEPGSPVPIDPASATRVFEGLRRSLRETDVVGWYSQDKVAGAVLAERTDPPGSAVSHAILKRVGEMLEQRLPARVARTLRVQEIELGPTFTTG